MLHILAIVPEGRIMANPPEVALPKLTESLRLINGALGHLNELHRVSTSPELRADIEQLHRVAHSLDGLRMDIEQAIRQRRERKQR